MRRPFCCGLWLLIASCLPDNTNKTTDSGQAAHLGHCLQGAPPGWSAPASLCVRLGAFSSLGTGRVHSLVPWTRYLLVLDDVKGNGWGHWHDPVGARPVQRQLLDPKVWADELGGTATTKARNAGCFDCMALVGSCNAQKLFTTFSAHVRCGRGLRHCVVSSSVLLGLRASINRGRWVPWPIPRACLWNAMVNDQIRRTADRRT